MVFKDKFLKNSIIVFVSSAIANVANLLYQVLVVKKLSVESYGAFNSLLSIFMIISLPLGSLNVMIIKFTSAYNNIGERKKADFFLFVLFKRMLFLGIFFLIVYLIFGFNFKNYLHLDSIIPVYLTGGMLFLSILSIAPTSGLQGLEKFIWFSVNGVLSVLLKLSLGFLLLSLGWGLVGALGAYIAAQILALFICFFVLNEVFCSDKNEIFDIDLKEKYKFIIPSFIMFGCVAVLTNLDVVLVKHFFIPIEAGYYSVAQLIGRIVLFLPGAIYIVMFPQVAGLHAQQKDSRDLLIRGLKYTAVLCSLIIVLYNIFPEIFLNLLTGKSNNITVFLGRLFTISMTFFSLVVVLLLYQLSISKFRFIKSLVLFTLLQIIAILLFHNTLTQVLCALLINSIILFILNLRSAFQT